MPVRERRLALSTAKLTFAFRGVAGEHFRGAAGELLFCGSGAVVCCLGDCRLVTGVI